MGLRQIARFRIILLSPALITMPKSKFLCYFDVRFYEIRKARFEPANSLFRESWYIRKCPKEHALCFQQVTCLSQSLKVDWNTNLSGRWTYSKRDLKKIYNLLLKKRKSWKMDVHIDRLCTSEIWCPLPDNLPKISLPRAWYPPITNTCEWSAVETIRVSSGLVNSMAVSMAASNVSTSCKAALALLAWWPWSIRPPITTHSVVKSYSSFHTNQVTWFCKACRASY